MTRLDDLKAQLAELDTLVNNGTLTGEAARAARNRLEAEVLRAVAPAVAAEAGEPAARPSGKLLAAVAAFVLVFAAAGYAWRGNQAGWSVNPGDAPPPEAHQTQPKMDAAQFEAMTAKLAERLKTQPDDAKGWSMLGRSYAVLGRHEQSAQAYKRLTELTPQDAQAFADYADALGTAHGRKLDGEPEKAIATALKLDPDNPKALALAGTVAFEQGRHALAAQHWERALRRIDADTPLAQQLRGAVAEARQRAGLPPLDVAAAPSDTAAQTAATAEPAGSAVPGTATGAATAAATAAATGQAALQVRVSLDPALAKRVSPDDTVFIFARAAGTERRAPLAIQRRRVADLPVDLVLDDSMAMSPQNTLSSVREVVVGARISKTGEALSRPGDLQGLSAPVAVGSRGLQLRIDQVLP